MEYMEKIISNIKLFLSSRFQMREENEIELNFIRLNGLSNIIYLVKIFDKTSNVLIKELIYRSFGNISEFVDRETEMALIDNLSASGLTPSVYETDKTSYRIEEYIGNSDTLNKEYLQEDFIIEKIVNILIAYSLISSIYNFHIVSDELQKDYKITFDPVIQKVKQNMFDKCLNMMFVKAKNNFEKFSKKISKKYENFISEEVNTKIDKIKHYMENYKNLFIKIFPKNGLVSLCHNDVHRLNLLLTEDTEKVIILDHEYACMNLVGVDIVNYLIETKFEYTSKTFPFYEFDNENFDLDFSKFYETFLKFMQKFQATHSVEHGNKFQYLLEKSKTEKYFYRLVCVINLFWLLYTLINLDYDEFTLKNKFCYLSHGIDRINLFEKAYSAMNKAKDVVKTESI